MRPSRRMAIKQFAALVGASALAGNPGVRAQESSEPSIEQYLGDPLLQPVCVKDFEPLAKAKLDPLAYDYLVGGSEDEVSLRDNRSGFDRIVIRPKALVDVHSIRERFTFTGGSALAHFYRITFMQFLESQSYTAKERAVITRRAVGVVSGLLAGLGFVAGAGGAAPTVWGSVVLVDVTTHVRRTEATAP